MTVPENYGYVVLVALGLTPILAFAQGNVVTGLRKAAGVPYPNPYATPQQAKEKPAAYKFNCAQRAHANLLENMPQTMMYMLFAGLEYPSATAALGAGWLLFRALYAYGYVQGQKENGGSRMYGAPGWLMQGGLWALCISTAFKML
ncbi:hypothetical protein H2202_005493 [Exophiala xenobiotica]|uniref:Glutathione S-transferase n=1 Tax=Vermiconidia calcicola TaxID=1690605 RepID=A0AAV9QEX0_9PEZI|nr:hypothetical protein H2202_005493 [Exophiala xenobiotica]KAK5536428.1 hypothetical protein LTR23_007862 [Chaetothyriales sp. CCFEE 6169]KAK5541413.1 hypothetical protein LTR25_003190 [Vermiconidia calcicola]KAK5214265.1 hypothetical protein LTR41_000457 [Exophiala xenobiotica]KAK5260954.1 hypothetical protein LTR40_003144 [Exophiala xenobiotica]